MIRARSSGNRVREGEDDVAIAPDFNHSGGGSRAALERVPQRRVLADDVYDIIRAALLSHRIEPGAHLNLDQLARDLHVSNTPVRQALARLEAEGLVTKEPYRGFSATALVDIDTLMELYEFRLLIEPPCAAKAALRASEDARARITATCDPGTLQPLLDAADIPALGGLDAELHQLIAREAGNTAIAEAVESLFIRATPFGLYLRQTGSLDLAWEEHGAVVAAILGQDPEGAEEAMRVHLVRGRDRFEAAVH
jgi:DNA-binding GntR family transcriptional regulator